MLVELGFINPKRNPVEIRKQIGCELSRFVLTLSGGSQEIIDQHLGMDLLLYVKGWCVDDEIAPVLLILAAPNQLWIEVAIALIARFDRMLLFFLHYGLIFSGRNVFPLGLIM